MRKLFFALLLLTAQLTHATFPGPSTSVNDQYLWGVPTFVYDSTWLTIPAHATYWPYYPYIDMFRDAGTKLYVFTTTASRSDYTRVTECWTSTSTWVYTGFGTVDDLVSSIVTRDPDALLMFRIDIGTPDWWLEDPANEDELEKLYNGWTVCDSDFGVAPRRGPFPSLASTAWREDMALCLSEFVDHIENSSYADNIFGFIITGLGTDEWYHWGSGTDKFWGYGDRTVEDFRAWLTAKYTTDTALRAAWNNTTVTLANATVPGYWDRKDEGLYTTFRNPATKMPVIDFLQYWNELIPDTIDYFANELKTLTENTKVVGGMYGYMNEFAGNPEFGHNALGRYLQSDDLDFIFSCISYGNRGLGGGTATRSQHTSIEHHGKLLFTENDTATTLTRPRLIALGTTEPLLSHELGRLGYTDTLWKNQQILRRDAGFDLCHGIYHDYFDLHGGYYDSPTLMAEVDHLNNDLFDRMANYDRSSIAEILIVSDEVSCNYALNNSELLKQAMYEPLQQLIKIGAPYDHVLLDDIDTLDCDRYKLVVFLNCYNMTDDQRDAIDTNLKGDDRLLVWCYAAGYFNGTSMDIADLEATTGFEHAIGWGTGDTYYAPQIEILPAYNNPIAQAISNKGFTTFGPSTASCKRITIQDSNAWVMGRYPGSTLECNMAFKDMGDWESIYAATASMPAGVYRELARYAGVHLFLDNSADDTVYANKMFVTIHAATAGNKTLKLPTSYTIYNALTQDWMATSNTLTRSFSQGETFIYQYQ